MICTQKLTERPTGLLSVSVCIVLTRDGSLGRAEWLPLKRGIFSFGTLEAKGGVRRPRKGGTDGRSSQPRSELLLEGRRGIRPAHRAENVEQLDHGAALVIHRLPQIKDSLGRTRLRREIIYVPVHLEAMRQHPPVVPSHVGRIEKLAQQFTDVSR